MLCEANEYLLAAKDDGRLEPSFSGKDTKENLPEKVRETKES